MRLIPTGLVNLFLAFELFAINVIRTTIEGEYVFCSTDFWINLHFCIIKPVNASEWPASALFNAFILLPVVWVTVSESIRRCLKPTFPKITLSCFTRISSNLRVIEVLCASMRIHENSGMYVEQSLRLIVFMRKLFSKEMVRTSVLW